MAGTLSLVTYAARIHHIRSLLDHAGNLPDHSVLDRAAGALRHLSSVRLPDGATVHTDTPDLALLLGSGDQHNVHQAISRLHLLDDALRSTPIHRADPAALRQLDSILAEPRFHPSVSLFDQLGTFVNGLINDLLNLVDSLLSPVVNGTSPLVDLIVALAFLAVVAGLAFLLGRALLRRTVAEVVAGEVPDAGLTALAAARRAADLRAAGDQRLALRYLLFSVLLSLQERGILTLRPGVTNHEYLQRVSRENSLSPEQIEALRTLVGQFDRSWYGRRPLAAEEYDRLSDLAGTIRGARTAAA